MLALAPCLCSAVRNDNAHLQDEMQSDDGTALCDATGVREDCVLMGGDSEKVALGDLKESLAAADAAADTFLKTVLPGNAPGEPLNCQNLCQATIAFIGKRTVLPPSTDVGCYRDGDKVVCDLDLAPRSMEDKLQLSGSEIPDMRDASIRTEKQTEKFAADVSDLKSGKKATTIVSKSIEYSVLQMAVRVANLFRIYPLPGSTFESADGAHSMLLETDSSANGSIRTESQCPRRCRTEGFCVAYQSECGGCAFCGSVSAPNRNWQVEVQQRSLQAQAYINTAIRQFKKKATKDHINKWFGADAFSNKRTRKEVLRVLNSVDDMLGNVHYVYPGKECAMGTYAYVYSAGAPDESPEDTKTSKGEFIFYVCSLYVYAEDKVQVETLVHEGSHHASAFTDDVCMDEINDPSKAVTLVVKTKKELDVDDDLNLNDLLMLDDGSIVMVRNIEKVRLGSDKVTLQLDPPRGSCKQKAYGRGPCAKLAKQVSWKALRNADNFCYYVQDITDAR